MKRSAVEELRNKLLELDSISYDSIDHLMRRIMKKYDMTAKELHNAFVNKYHTTPDAWIKKQMNEDLRDWFGKGREGGVGGGGWDRYNSKGERIGKCARENPSEAKPKCLSKEKASQLRSQGGVKAIANAVKRKRKKDPTSDRSGKGGKPIMVSNKIKEAKEEHRYCKLCGKTETRDECSWGGNFWDRYSIKGYNPTKPHPGNFPESFDIDPKKHREVSRQEKIRNLASKTNISGEKEAAERKLKGPKLPSVKEEYIQEKNSPTNPSLWSRIKSRAKSKFDVYPSAYANGWAAKEYKKAGGGWKTVSENNLTQEAANLAQQAAIAIDMKREEKKPKEVKEDCWSGYVQRGLKKKRNKMVPNCVPSKKYQKEDVTIEDAYGNAFIEIVDVIVPGKWGQTVTKESKNTSASVLNKTVIDGTRESVGNDPKNSPGNTNSTTPSNSASKAPPVSFESFVSEASAAWQRKEGKNPEGGLNKKGISSYRKEHPGSHLSLAVTKDPSKLKPGSKSANRRKSFCSRMKGLKNKLTSKKTANDPNSRVNKSLRKWNC